VEFTKNTPARGRRTTKTKIRARLSLLLFLAPLRAARSPPFVFLYTSPRRRLRASPHAPLFLGFSLFTLKIPSMPCCSVLDVDTIYLSRSYVSISFLKQVLHGAGAAPTPHPPSPHLIMPSIYTLYVCVSSLTDRFFFVSVSVIRSDVSSLSVSHRVPPLDQPQSHIVMGSLAAVDEYPSS